MPGVQMLREGDLFAGEFRVLRRLAEGGMGAVYVVEQRSTGRQRALKVMHPSLVPDERSRERFAEEAKVGSQVDSEHVVEVIGAGVDAETGMPWLCMELLEGQSFEQLVQERGALPPSEVRELLEDVCHALAAAHARGIIHRDLKPENLFVARSRRRTGERSVKILDFGIARAVERSRTAATVTTAIGSPLWMAPEQAQAGAKLRPSTDVWALGLVAFYLLTGRSFWLAANVGEFNLSALLVEMMTKVPPPASTRAAELGAPALPAGFDAWFARCVAQAPEARFEDAGAAARGLSDALGAEPGERAVPPTEPTTTPRPGRAPVLELQTQFVVRPSSPARVEAPPAPVAPTAPVAASRTPLYALIGVVVLLAGGGAAILLTSSSEDPPTPELNAGASTVAHDAGSGGSDAGGEPPVVAASPPPDCPDGMIGIPGGTFTMGSPEGVGADGERPPTQVTLDAYCLDRTEVTVRAYEECVSAGACQAQDSANWSGITARDRRGFSLECSFGRVDRSDHPMNCVDWNQADAYCRWRGGRLPTEAEWEYAARGTDGRTYPWGNEAPSRSHLRWSEPGWEVSGTAPVGSYPAGASPFGVQDLAGNVWEWVSDWYGRYPGGATSNPRGAYEGSSRVTRGGGWNDYDPLSFRAANRNFNEPALRRHGVGFRCARGGF